MSGLLILELPSMSMNLIWINLIQVELLDIWPLKSCSEKGIIKFQTFLPLELSGMNL